MSNSEWNKVDFQDFINKFNKNVVIDTAPTILYSKKDKEHEAYNALIAFFFISGFLLIYISVSMILIELYFSLILFVVVIITAAIADVILLLIYLRSNIAIKPLESWIEIYESLHEGNENYYCFSYYIVFSGKCVPNKAKNVIYKLYQENLLKSKIDITQIEIYLKKRGGETNKLDVLGYFFQYGEGKPFKSENIDRNAWKFFPYEISFNENYLAIANWDHQYEWRNDLELDYDKLHDYAPWVITTWNEENLKPLTDVYKQSLNWDLRQLESKPKLKPWLSNLETQTYESFRAYKDLQLMNEAIENVIGNDKELKKLKDLKGYLLKIRAYFRDLNY
ncbi:MAG: hypothetical protein ACFE8M_01690 [Candidatus Hermodarchaeota archaeon]